MNVNIENLGIFLKVEKFFSTSREYNHLKIQPRNWKGYARLIL